MTAAKPLYEGFNSGELGDELGTRAGFDRYAKGAEIMENLLPLVQGPMVKRPGTRYITTTKASTGDIRLLPFRFSAADAMVLEMGVNYFRFFRNQEQITVADTDGSITNGTFDSDIASWTDKSTGAGALSWVAAGRMRMDPGGVTATDIAWCEQAVTIDASYTAVEHVVRFRTYGEIDSAPFSVQVGTATGLSDILAETSLTAGFHTISFTPGQTTFYLQFLVKGINSPAEGSLTAGAETYIELDDVTILDNVPLELVTPFTGGGDMYCVKTAQSGDIMYITCPASGTYKLERRGLRYWGLQKILFKDGPYDDPNTTDTTLATAAAALGPQTVTASAVKGINNNTGFTSDDIGRLVRLQTTTPTEAGWGVITAVASTTSITVFWLRIPNSTGASAQWWLGQFSDALGYPRAITFHQQRLYLGGSTTYPTNIWASQIIDITLMRQDSFVSSSLQVEDDDAFVEVLASQEINPILSLSSLRKLIVLTSSEEGVGDSQGVSITANDKSFTFHSFYGSKDRQGVKVDNSVLFIHRGGHKLFEMFYDFRDDGYVANDDSLIAPHMGGTAEDNGFDTLVYQQEPYSVLWAARDDGQIAALTLRRREDVVGWTRHLLGGTVLSVDGLATIPGGAVGDGRLFDSTDTDELWLIVSRTINSTTARFVEVMERPLKARKRGEFESHSDWSDYILPIQKTAFYVDAGIYYNSTATATITGLDHLEGETVAVWADGAEQATAVVSSGQITIDPAASQVVVGLPYTRRWKSLRPNFGSQTGSGHSLKKAIHKVWPLLRNTHVWSSGPSFADQQTEDFRNVALDSTDTAAPLFSGIPDDPIYLGAKYDPNTAIYMKSSDPGPFECMGMTAEMQTGEVQ